MAETLKSRKIDVHKNIKGWIAEQIAQTYQDTRISLQDIKTSIEKKSLESELQMPQVLGVLQKMKNKVGFGKHSAGEVFSVQIALKSIGLEPGIIDGVYTNDSISNKFTGKENKKEKNDIYRQNSKTRAAVEQFQINRNNEHPEDQIGVDGWVGKQTLTRLISQFEKSISPGVAVKMDNQEKFIPPVKPQNPIEIKKEEDKAVADTTRVAPVYVEPKAIPVVKDEKAITTEPKLITKIKSSEKTKPVEKPEVKEKIKDNLLDFMWTELLDQKVFTEQDKSNYDELLKFIFNEKSPSDQKKFLDEVYFILMSDDSVDSKKGQVFLKISSFIGSNIDLERARQGLYKLQKNPKDGDAIRKSIRESLDMAERNS